jgi:hypothetical protein
MLTHLFELFADSGNVLVELGGAQRNVAKE